MLRKTFETSAFVALILVAWIWVIGWASNAFGQSNNTNTWQTPGNQTVGGFVDMCINAAGLAVPCNGAGSGGTAGYPAGATPITASSTGTTGAVTATLAGVAGKTTYVCSVQIGEAGSGTATATATGTISGTLNYVVTAPGNFTVTYTPCVPASAANTAIVVATAANATATAVAVTATGYQL